jgi:hypothetical protein
MNWRPLSLALALLFAGCGELRVIPKEGEGTTQEVPITITGLKMSSYSGPRLTQVIEADRSQLYLNEQRALLDDLEMNFYEGDEVVSTLQADHGEADLATDDFHAEGRTQRIRITREDQRLILYANQLIYDPRENRLHTEGEFVIVQFLEGGSAQIIRGAGVTTDPRLERVELTGLRSERQTHLDLAAFEREVRPITQENPS